MSTVEFQRALCDLTLNPRLAASLLHSGAALRAYDLTPIESSRLEAVVRQRGMSLNCTLARANRFAPIADAFPLTCSLLKPQLRALLDELWSGHRPEGYQLSGEVEAFATFIRARLADGTIEHPYAEEVFGYDSAAWSLIQSLRTASSNPSASEQRTHTASVCFRHDPHAIVPPLERDEIPPPGLPAREYVVTFVLRGDVLEVQAAGVLEPGAACV
jgi:hypothetical protein